MKISLSPFVLLLCLPIIFEAAGQTLDESTAAANERYSLVKSALEQLHREEFDSVFAISALLRERDPQGPLGYLIAADAYNTMMRDYRVRIYETQFDSLINLAVIKSKQLLEKEPSAENYFISGAAEGYRSLYLFRCGKWLKAIKSAFNSIGLQKQALELDSGFVDPLLGLGVYEYAKSKVLFGVFSGNRDDAIEKLERVCREARFVAVNAQYSLELIYLEAGEFERAFEINEQLYRQYPRSSVCLYYRALLLEKQSRFEEAFLTWEKVISRVEAFGQDSNGFLAECYFHLATIHLRSGDPDKAWEELIRAARYAGRHRPVVEMDGPYISFGEIKKEINRALREWH